MQANGFGQTFQRPEHASDFIHIIDIFQGLKNKFWPEIKFPLLTVLYGFNNYYKNLTFTDLINSVEQVRNKAHNIATQS